MSDPLLSLDNITVRFGDFVAVNGVSLELRGGELLGLIGPNGAGKTTTLRAAAGLQPLSAGQVRVFGRDAARYPAEVGAHLGFTPDTPAVSATLTVAQFLDFGRPRSAVSHAACASDWPWRARCSATRT